MAFQLDTSGIVLLPRPGAEDRFKDGWRFEDLDPFTQGYVKALFAESDGWAAIDLSRPGQYAFRGFSDLAPETLARIMEDCAADQRAGLKLNIAGNTEDRTSFKAGAEFWWERQSGNLFDARPLTVILCDDGKVRFSDQIAARPLAVAHG